MNKMLLELQLIEYIKSNYEITKEIIIKAQELQLKNKVNRLLCYDQFGFLIQRNKCKIKEHIIKRKRRKANKALIEWLEILNDYPKYKLENYYKLKLMIRRGIPDCLRAEVWPILAEIEQLKEDNNDVYNSLLEKIKCDIDEPETKDEIVILKDIMRTFPTNVLYVNILSKGQCELYNVLSVYSMYNKELGYVSGMNYLAGLFLTYMDEESSFWFLHWFIVKYNLGEYYNIDYPELKRSLYVLLSLIKVHLPKLYVFFRDKKVSAITYASQWFITFFSSVLKFDFVVRILDILLFEGYKVLFRIGLGLLKLKQKTLLLCTQLEDIMLILKNISIGIDVDALFKCSFSISFSRNDIFQYEELYEKKKNDDKDELIRLIGL